MEVIRIYTDGACSGNPGPGGFGVILEYKGITKSIAEGFKFTTNNRMELMAVLVGLECLKHEGMNVEIYSDSKYVVDAVEKNWIHSWVKKNFKDKKNEDLWRRYLALSVKHKIKFIWIKGHAGHPQNEKCDLMAVEAYKRKNLHIDEGYEKN